MRRQLGQRNAAEVMIHLFREIMNDATERLGGYADDGTGRRVHVAGEADEARPPAEIPMDEPLRTATFRRPMSACGSDGWVLEPGFYDPSRSGIRSFFLAERRRMCQDAGVGIRRGVGSRRENKERLCFAQRLFDRQLGSVCLCWAVLYYWSVARRMAAANQHRKRRAHSSQQARHRPRLR